MRLSTVVVFVAGSIGGAVGWWMGERLGVFTAFMFSIVATAAAMYFTRRWARSYFP
jgi:hypothetical protein